MTVRKLSFALATLGTVLFACESTSSKPATSTFGNDAEGDAGAAGAVGVLGTPEPDTNAAAADFQTCATAEATVESRPIYLVFMFDKSGSMVADNSPKWNSAKAASKAFFTAPESAGVNASLTFFPDQLDYTCGPDVYAKPTVAMKALPSNDFGASLDAQFPNGGTPTHDALDGAIHYAQTVAANEGKDGKVAVVLVTDGLPESDCVGNSVPAVAALASSVAQTVPTYVIGVGDELTSLTEIAAGGGTKSAFIVNTNAPEQIQTDFLAAINAIKLSAFSCDYAVPTPPSGQQLNKDQVDVVHLPADRTVATDQDKLTYNPTCKGGAGWHYDDAEAPKRIELCNASCDDAKSRPGKLQVRFGCAPTEPRIK